MILTVIESIVAQIADPMIPTQAMEYGHGAPSYSNLRKSKYSSIWLFPFTIIDTMTLPGTFLSTYQILITFSTKSDLKASPAQLRAQLELMEAKSKEFEVKMSWQKIVSGITNIQREPLYHVLDANMVGYALKMNVAFKFEAFGYCPNSTIIALTINGTDKGDGDWFFKATPANSVNPHYQWMVNNENAGTDSDVFEQTLSADDIVSCTMTTESFPDTAIISNPFTIG